jgi:hypothetical protein
MATRTVDYKAIAAKRITRPAEQTRRPKLLIYGRNKKGKSTFISTAGVDKVLYLDPERGTDEMKTTNPHVWHFERWEDIDDYYQYLRGGDHPYTWAGIDGLTKMSNMALNYVMRVAEERSLDRQPGMVQQRDYGKAGELMKLMLTQFHNLPMGVVFTAQERMIEASDAEEDEESEAASAMYVPDLPKGVRSSVNALVDVIGRLYTVKVDDKPERRLWIGDSNKYDTGYRSDFELPPFIRKPTIPKLVRLIRTGKATAPTRSATS